MAKKLDPMDLKEIIDYIANDSVRYASITVHKIYNRTQDIIDNPYVGRIVPEINKKSHQRSDFWKLMDCVQIMNFKLIFYELIIQQDY